MEPWMFWTGMAVQAVLTVAAVTFLAFFKGYGSKKGENLATHEDIDMLVKQVEAVTTATKEIEAKISNDLWDRQKRWETKKDTFFELIKALSAWHDALSLVSASYKGANTSDTPLAPSWINAKAEAIDAWTKASESFNEAHMLTELVCDKELRSALSKINVLIRNIIDQVLNKNNPGSFYTSALDLANGVESVRREIRKELGIEDV